MGTTQVLRLDASRGEVKARVSARDPVTPGERVGLDFRSQTVTLLDAETGRALRSATNDVVLRLSEAVLRDVSKRVDRDVAVNVVSLTISDGSFTALLGPTGAGKNTTLRFRHGAGASRERRYRAADHPGGRGAAHPPQA